MNPATYSLDSMLIEGAEMLGVGLDESQRARLLAYLKYFIQWNSIYNLAQFVIRSKCLSSIFWTRLPLFQYCPLAHFFRIRHWLWRWSARRRAGYFKARLAGDTQRCRSEENGFSDPFKNGFASSECSGFSKPRRVAAFFRWRAHRCAGKITAKCSSIPRLLQSFQACFFDAPSCCAWRFNLGDEGRFS